MLSKHEKSCLFKVPIFNHLNENEQVDISNLIRVKRLLKGDFLYHMGDTGAALYVVHQGKIKIARYNDDGLDKTVEQLKDVPVYITIDLDVLDPAVFPGTGTPEPGGMQYQDLLWAFDQFEKLNNIVGADIVELAPNLDPTGASTAVAVKSLRELVLILQKNLENKKT